MKTSTTCSSRREEAHTCPPLAREQRRKGSEENQNSISLSPLPPFTSATKTAPRSAASPSLPRGETQIQFSLATHADDSAIRSLLRNNPMAGAIYLSLEREPNYFADANQPGETKQTIVARKSGSVVCVGSCTTRLRFVNGQPRRVGYLSGLRLDSTVVGRFDILRRGYGFFRELQSIAPADYYFTSIATDNHRARHFLERNLRGMPRYEFIGDFVTLLIGAPSTASARHVNQQRAEPALGAPLRAAALNVSNQHFQLAPHWTAAQLMALRQLGLRDKDWIGDAAVWDQRCFKQTVIRGYAPWLALLRPAINLVARLNRRPGLPAAGQPLSHASTSPSTVTDPGFLNHLCSIAAQRGIEWLTLGLAANDPRLPLIRQQFRSREYRSRLYLVSWPGLGGVAADLDKRILAPEVALL